MAMELHAESHKDYLHHNIMSKMGDLEIAKQWFQLMAEEAPLEKKHELTEKKMLSQTTKSSRHHGIEEVNTMTKANECSDTDNKGGFCYLCSHKKL